MNISGEVQEHEYSHLFHMCWYVVGCNYLRRYIHYMIYIYIYDYYMYVYIQYLIKYIFAYINHTCLLVVETL